MDFLGRSCSSQEPNHLHGVMSFFFFTPSSTFVCFPILVFGLLFVSSHVGLYLIIVLLFLCQQFIPLPCHLITCCVNSVLLWHHSLPMMLSSGLLTCVDVCSFIGITAQVNTLRLGLWGLFSEGHTQADISVCLPLPSPVSLFLPVLFYFVVSFSSPFSHNSVKIILSAPFHSPSLFDTLSPSPTSIVHPPSLLCSQLSTFLICGTLSILLGLQSIQPIKYFFLLSALLFICLTLQRSLV